MDEIGLQNDLICKKMIRGRNGLNDIVSFKQNLFDKIGR